MNWKSLRAELAASAWLQPDDDIDTQRGLVATSIAILERMRDGERLRTVSWTPQRILERRTARLPPAPGHYPKPRPGPSNEGGGALVRAEPKPCLPRPGGEAVEIVW
jgi:hypothetical protein